MESIKELYKIGYGPSSSHTMGPQLAMRHFLERFPDASNIEVILYGSLALTGKGHLTDYIMKKEAHPKTVQFIWKPTVFQDQHPNALTIRATIHGNHTEQTFYSIGGGNIISEGDICKPQENIYPHASFTAISEYLESREMSLVEYIDMYDEGLESHLQQVLTCMKQAIKRGIANDDLLKGSLKIRRKSKLLYEQANNAEERMLAYAYATNEENASASGIIVTAPTCGACGTLPAVLLYAQEQFGFSDAALINALKVAGIIGTLIKTNASISGAEAGCQAEVGSATSMAASALAYLQGGDIHMIEAAAEIAMEHQLGLTCDPVDGYVQIPCIQRNAVAAQKALTAVKLAQVLKHTETVSFDTIVHVMYETGKDLPFAYRETSKGGLAVHYKKKKVLGPMC